MIIYSNDLCTPELLTVYAFVTCSLGNIYVCYFHFLMCYCVSRLLLNLERLSYEIVIIA